MRSFLPRGILLVVLLLLASFPTIAQDAAGKSAIPAGSPFEASIVPATQADYDACANSGLAAGKNTVVGLDMRNNAAKPLRGYVVAVWYHEIGSGYVMHDTVSKLVHPGDPVIQPGAEWHTSACGMPKNADLDDPKAQVDLLMYADGSTWGPAELPESNRSDGQSIGMSFRAGGDAEERGYVTATPVAAEMIGDPIQTKGFSTPLEFYGVQDRDGQGNLLLVVHAKNTGDVPVIGYEYAITFLDSATGDVIKSVTTKALETHGDPAGYLQPGETWASGGRKIPASANGAPADYTITLDAVVLADGHVLGPRYSRESDELLGMIEGLGETSLYYDTKSGTKAQP